MLRTIIIDDEQLAGVALEHLLRTYAEIMVEGVFQRSSQAIDYVKYNAVDLVFLDIEMPGINGVDAADLFQQLERPPIVIFVTAHAEYSMEAWRLAAADYVLKPFTKEQIDRAISRAVRLSENPDRRQPQDAGQIPALEFRCFPSFDMLMGGQPYAFRNKKAKELLAYLVHSRGNWVHNNELIYILFEDKDEDAGKNSFRQVLFRLRKELKNLELSHILATDYGRCRINLEGCRCDYLDYLAGNNTLFHGEYLREYSWAEPTTSYLLQSMKSTV